MLFSLLSGGNPRDALINILLTLPVIIIALSVHEASHGFIAYKMGDRTAYNLGRITLNPLKHLDLKGTLFMLVFGYGWAKPVPINTRNFKDPKKGMALTALAGPVSNLILGMIGAFFYELMGTVISYFVLSDPLFFSEHELLFRILYIALNFFYLFGILNVILAVFNMIPLPPFDGSRVFYVFLPQKYYFKVMQYEQYILIGVLGIFLIFSYFFRISPVGWIADNLFELICLPFGKLFGAIFF